MKKKLKKNIIYIQTQILCTYTISAVFFVERVNNTADFNHVDVFLARRTWFNFYRTRTINLNY